MLKPKELDRLPAAMVELYSQVEMDALRRMAERINAIEDFIPASQWQYRKLIEMGNYHSYIVKALAAMTGRTEAEIKRLIREAGQKTLKFDDEIYRSAGLFPPPLAASPAIQSALDAGLTNTMGLFENLTRTTADTSTRQFERALDRAWLQVSTGAFSHQEAARMAIKDMSQRGLASIEYPSGHVDYLDVAVRRAVLTGVNQTALKVQETRADELGSDLVEVSAHAGARIGIGVANHSEWQGKVYSRSGTHRKYPSFIEKTGYGTGPGLGGWNCRHSFFPFFEGLSTPAYTKKELEELNAPKYEYNGKKLTEQEATDRQRYLERQIRRWKREKAAMKAAGLETSESSAKLKQWQDTQKDFLDQTGLKRQYDREMVVQPKTVQGAADFGGAPVPIKKDAAFSTNIPGYSQEVNQSITRAAKHTVTEGGKRGGEHLVLVDSRTGEWAFEEAGDIDVVGNSDSFRSFIEQNQGRRFSYVHSHPSGNGFSLNDMAEFFGADQFDSMVAAGYNGKVYTVFGKRQQISAWDEVMKPSVDTALAKDLRVLLKEGKIDTSEFRFEVERRRVAYLIEQFCSEWGAQT